MKISLITPSYKRTKFLKKNYKLLSRIYKKYPKNLEWVIITEKIDHKSNRIVKKFNKKFVKHLTKNFKNNDFAFNYGVKHSTGNLLVIYGDDDYINEKFIEELKKHYKKKIKWYLGYGLYINDKNEISRKIITKIKSFLIKNYNKDLLLIINYIMTPSVAFSKSEFLKIKGLNKKSRYASDYFLWLEFSRKHKPKIIDKYLSKATFTKFTKTGSFSINRYTEMLEIIKSYNKKPHIYLLQFLSIYSIIIFNFLKKKILRI